jgi:biotin synthase
MAGDTLTRDEARSVLALPDSAVPTLVDAASTLRLKYRGRYVGIQLLTNVRSGNCTQDCAYCAQSSVSTAPIAAYDFVSDERLRSDSAEAATRHLSRHCIGLSGIRCSDEDIAALCDRVRALKAASSVPVCCSIGLLMPTQAKALKAAGVDRINHNLNTSLRFYPSICSTHTYYERIANLAMLKSVGFELCCGGIIGLGETDDDNVDMLLAIHDIYPESAPINFLLPLPGTPLERIDTARLTPWFCLKVLSLARLLMPKAEIRVAAGRERYLTGYEREMLSVADSIFAQGYLTAGGQSLDDTIAMVERAGYTSRLD